MAPAAGPTAAMFKRFQEELDFKYDKYEALIKLSRDLTIESKRIIFQMHRIVDRVSDDRENTSRRCALLSEAEQNLSRLLKSKVHAMADLLRGEDHYQYSRAYSPGIQEFVEASAFHSVLSVGRVPSLTALQESMTFKQEEAWAASKALPTRTMQGTTDGATDYTATFSKDRTAGCVSKPGEEALFIAAVYLSYDDYLLGLADVTGELMRLAINSISKGDTVLPSDMCHLVRDLCNGSMSVAPDRAGGLGPRNDLFRKTDVMKKSLTKIEDACYALKVRGSERPLMHLLESKPLLD